MTDTTERAVVTGRAGLAAMNVAELKRLASGLGITGAAKMRKSDLVAAISARPPGQPRREADRPEPDRPEPDRPEADRPEPDRPEADRPEPDRPEPDRSTEAGAEPRRPEEAPAEDRRAEATGWPAGNQQSSVAARPDDRGDQGDQGDRADSPVISAGSPPTREHFRAGRPRDQQRETRDEQREARDEQSRNQSQGAVTGSESRPRVAAPAGGRQPVGDGSGPDAAQAGAPDDADDGRGGRRRSRQRSRDRKRGRSPAGGAQEYEPELQITDDDVLVPVAGILDVLDNYAFIRTTGYLPGPSDVYVPLGLVRRYQLRNGDAVTGAIKAPRDGEQSQGAGRQKFSALVRLDTINGMSPDQFRARVEFGRLTPLYPHERLRLETEAGQLTTRVVDLVAPIGKGQRGLLLVPPNAGTTMVLQALANAVTQNNPECHLMVVLVDERPEEVTEMQRAVKGEVIAATFDRPADDHVSVAELSIERAKRLVELGHDVVVLLDSITKLARAYNVSAQGSGRAASGGVDPAALYPPKRFFGAARNIENGGSLTVIATALVETGSRTDELIFDEFRGTANMELRLSRDLASRRIFPAVDVNASGTRREELLLSPEELRIVSKLRRVLGGLQPQAALELLLDRLRRTRTNIEFLRQVQSSTSAQLDVPGGAGAER